jgi:hypothetical protein
MLLPSSSSNVQGSGSIIAHSGGIAVPPLNKTSRLFLSLPARQQKPKMIPKQWVYTLS